MPAALRDPTTGVSSVYMRWLWSLSLALLLLLPQGDRLFAQVDEGATLIVLRGQVAIVQTSGVAVQPAPSGSVVRAGDEIRTLSGAGRALDHLPSSIEVLPAIVEAVDGKAEVIVDSGFLRGTDVVKAIALGAKAVLVGKLQTWGLAAADEAGLDRVLELLDREIRESLQLLGVKSLDELRPSHLRPATPTRHAVDEWNRYEVAPLPRL